MQGIWQPDLGASEVGKTSQLDVLTRKENYRPSWSSGVGPGQVGEENQIE